MTTEAWAKPPLDQPDLTRTRINIERRFRHAATLGTEAADLDVAGYWLRDADAATPDPNFAAKLVRAVMTGTQPEQFLIASDWLKQAAIAFAENEEAKAADAGSLYDEHETPVECVQSMRRAP